MHLYFVAHTCICILFLPEEWKYCTILNLTALLISLFSIDIFYQHCLPSAYRWVRKD